MLKRRSWGELKRNVGRCHGGWQCGCGELHIRAPVSPLSSRLEKLRVPPLSSRPEELRVRNFAEPGPSTLLRNSNYKPGSRLSQEGSAGMTISAAFFTVRVTRWRNIVIPAPARNARGKTGGDPGKPIASKESLVRFSTESSCPTDACLGPRLSPLCDDLRPCEAWLRHDADAGMTGGEGCALPYLLAFPAGGARATCALEPGSRGSIFCGMPMGRDPG